MTPIVQYRRCGACVITNRRRSRVYQVGMLRLLSCTLPVVHNMSRAGTGPCIPMVDCWGRRWPSGCRYGRHLGSRRTTLDLPIHTLWPAGPTLCRCCRLKLATRGPTPLLPHPWLAILFHQLVFSVVLEHACRPVFEQRSAAALVYSCLRNSSHMGL